jgi:2-polyprenyl-3-methyl-5-hydroxy-6-metoxy-1,4-benzoquinol methylase
MNNYLELNTSYYNQRGKEFFDRSVIRSATEQLGKFILFIPKDGTILDAGCGSGRDTKTFNDLGYKVTSFDGSEKMVELATEYTGLPIQHMTFEDMAFDQKFDGIWACATLLHLPHDVLKSTLHTLWQYLEKSGVFYMSFKYGDHEELWSDRFFNFQNETRITKLIEPLLNAHIIDLWKTPDIDPVNKPDWLNVLVQKL